MWRIGVKKQPKPRLPLTHDFTAPVWGHAASIIRIEGDQLRLTGHGDGIQINDYVILKNGAGTTRYRIFEMHYMRDPPDQWFATAEFAPRDAV